MEKLTLKQIADFVGGQVFGDPQLPVTGVVIDSRKVQRGDLFVALAGERVDGHAFVVNAVQTAAGALVERKWAEQNLGCISPGHGLVAVEAVLPALQQLAKHYRDSFTIPVIGVTGSCGKTSTKDMIAAVLGERFMVHKTSGNFNNELGLPLTLLNLNSAHQAAVVEMGMRGRGEIEFLAGLARPSIGVITNIGTTHLELLGSQENIALAKGELLQALPPDGVAVLNADDSWCMRLADGLTGKIITYGIENQAADVLAQEITAQGEQGTFFRVSYDSRQVEVILPVPGRHNVANALAAIAVGLALGLSLAECSTGLARLEMSAMRLEISTAPGGFKLINDTYNANPTSTQASLQVLGERAAGLPKFAVLGSMFELGDASESGHKQVGACAAAISDLTLLTVGDLAKHIAEGALEQGMDPSRVHTFGDAPEALVYLQGKIPAGAWVLVKGSRGMRMERIVKGLLESSQSGGE